MNTPNMLDAALALAGKGLPGFPCGLDKRPFVKDWPNKATTDPAQVKAWWTEHPDASIGCPCGPRPRGNGCFVLDVDLPDGPASLATLESKHGPLPATLEQRTGGGGRQLFFAWPKDRKVRNSTKKIGLGLDVRGDGGYVILPPSRHQSGARYTWIASNGPRPAQAPAWLLDLVASKRPESKPTPTVHVPSPAGGTPYGHKALEDECVAVRKAPKGSRNDTLNRAAHALGQLVAGGQLDRREVEDQLRSAAIVAGLPEQEIEKTLASGLGKGMGSPRAPQLAKAAKVETPAEKPMPAEQVFDAPEVRVEAEDDWTPTVPPWPVLSPLALPGLVGDFVGLATRKSEADPAAVLTTLLTRFGCEVSGFAPGRGPFLMVGDTLHRPRLFSCIVGNSSKSRKGTSGEPIKKLFTFEPDYVPASCSPGPLSSGEGLVYAVRDEVQSWNVDKGTGDGRMVVADPGVTDKRLFVYDQELAAGLHSTKREGNTLSTILRCLWDSGDVSPLTKRDRIRTTGANICLVSHITIHELKALLDQVQAFNGFGNRFLWVCARRRGLVPFPESMPVTELDALRRDLLVLINAAQNAVEVRMNEDARTLWGEVYPDLSKDHSGLAGCIINRGEAQALRLAMVYALLDGKALIESSHLAAGLAFWNYCRDYRAIDLRRPRGRSGSGEGFGRPAHRPEKPHGVAPRPGQQP